MTAREQYRFWLVGLAVALLAVYLLSGVLLPFVAGMAIAYFLDPACDRLQGWGWPRSLATSVVMAGVIVVVIAVVWLLVPLVQAQITGLTNSLPALIEGLMNRGAPLVALLEQYLPPEDMQQLRGLLQGQAGNIMRWIGTALGGLLSGGLAIINILSLIFITPVVTFYLLRDWDLIIARVDGWLPRRQADVIREQARLIDDTLAGFARGQATVCLFLAVFYGTALTIVGLKFGLIVGLMTGLLSFVPFVGTIVGFVTSLGLALAQFDTWWPVIIVLVIFVVGQVVEGNLLTPKLVGERIGLHPVWVIFALLAGGALFGFVGVLLGLPIAAMVGVLCRFGLGRYLRSRYYQGTASEPAQGQPGAT